MRLKRFLKNSAKSALLFSVCLFLGCSSSTTPSFKKDTAAQAIVDICKKEHNIDITSTLSGRTLWIYFPVENLLGKGDKPQKYTERFALDENKTSFTDGIFLVDYRIRAIPEKAMSQDVQMNKIIMENLYYKIWRVMQRVLFSMQDSDKDIQFVCVVTADIKNGIEVKEIHNVLDMKKVMYQNISWTEYRHRIVQDSGINPEAIGDKTGAHLDYHDISMGEFIALQIQGRIRTKFQGAEAEKNVDIDKAVQKATTETIRIYNFKDFTGVAINNLETNNQIVLAQQEVLARSKR